MRSILEIQADRAAALERLAELDREEAAIRAARDKRILAAFDADEKAKEIASRFVLTINTVNGVLSRNDRFASKRSVPISHLPAEQQRAYHKARKWGVGPGAARQMATAVPI